MKFIFSALLVSLITFAVTAQSGPGHFKVDTLVNGIRGDIINPGDTTFLRILNGIIVKNNYKIKEFGGVQLISDKQTIAALGIKTDLPLMLVAIKTFDIEYKIDSILYSRPDFITAFKYPTTVQLPISINGKLLSYEDRKAILPGLVLSKIKNIRYTNSEMAMAGNMGVTPFGVIELELK